MTLDPRSLLTDQVLQEALDRGVAAGSAAFQAAGRDASAGMTAKFDAMRNVLVAALTPALASQIDAIVQRVSELPDRTSPDDWPEVMLVTADELRQILADTLVAPVAHETPTPSLVKQLLLKLPDLFAPEIRLEDDGEIRFDWDQGSDCVLSLSLNESTGQVGWSGLFPGYGGYGRCSLLDLCDELRDVLTRYCDAETTAAVKRGRAGQTATPPHSAKVVGLATGPYTVEHVEVVPAAPPAPETPTPDRTDSCTPEERIVLDALISGQYALVEPKTVKWLTEKVADQRDPVVSPGEA